MSFKSWFNDNGDLCFFLTNAPRAPSTSTRRPFLSTARPAGGEDANRGRTRGGGAPGGVNPVPDGPEPARHVSPDPPEESPDDLTEPEANHFSPPLTRNKKKRKIRSPAQKTPELVRLSNPGSISNLNVSYVNDTREEPGGNGCISPVNDTEFTRSSPMYRISTSNRFENLDTDEPAPSTTGTRTTTSTIAQTVSPSTTSGSTQTTTPTTTTGTLTDLLGIEPKINPHNACKADYTFWVKTYKGDYNIYYG